MNVPSRRRVLALVCCSGVFAIPACGGDDPADPGTTSSSSGASADAGGSSSGGSSSGGSSSGGSSSGDSDAGDDAGTGVTVRGQVVSQNSKVTGAVVSIQGKTATSAADGTWAIAGVEIPYQATVVLAPALANEATTGARGVTVFDGLTTLNPVFPVQAKVTLSSAKLNGVLSGGAAFPNANLTNYQVRATSALSNGGAGWQGNPTLADKSFDVTAKWPAGQTNQNVSLLALEYSPTAGLPTAFSFLAGASVSIDNGETKTRDLTLDVAGYRLVQANVQAPPGYSPYRTGLSIAAANGGSGFHFSQDTTAQHFQFAVPVSAVFGEKLWTSQAASADGLYTTTGSIVIADDRSQFDFVMLPAGELLEPAADAAGVNSATQFSWTAVDPSCVYVVRMASSTDNSSQIVLYTSATSITLPADAGLSAAASYSWRASCEVPRALPASVDQIAKLNAPSPTMSTSGPPRSFASQ